MCAGGCTSGWCASCATTCRATRAARRTASATRSWRRAATASAGGDVRVRLLDADGKPLDALGAAEAAPVGGDELAREVRWPKPLAVLRGRPVCLEIHLRQAALFALGWEA